MDIVKNTKKIVIQSRGLQTDWKPVEDCFPSVDAACSRIDYLRSKAGTEIYRIVEETSSILSY